MVISLLSETSSSMATEANGVITTENVLASGSHYISTYVGSLVSVIQLVAVAVGSESEEEFDEENLQERKATEEKEHKSKKLKTGDEIFKRIEQVQLPDMDEYSNVPVYDDCDEIRKKINFVLGEKTVTKAAFLRALGDVNSNSLRSFMNLKRGAGSGATNVVYCTAYIFFEKKHILEDGKKNKKRLENKAKQGRQGFALRHDNGMRLVFVGYRGL
ncbi:hypothetical protein PHMEG_00033235 [Phytophthora megakarya]|uniref:DUF7726 domain-containing protein n=1 Tax=Phytophthora megakarya TaxID=4795 RepID=A0A225UV96_9STRA|nr:hypothetical protein PHMEG_00033235 [Phytophthora megakarya]